MARTPGAHELSGCFSFPVLIAALSLALVGCTSAGSAGGSSSGRSGPAPLAPAQPAANFLTAEFNANYGLGLINAEDVYARGAYGDGVVVAVIDTGIDTTHPDLDANISGLSRDLRNPGQALTDTAGHGTWVAGVIAAEKNDVGVHGVAFESTIMALRIDNNCTNVATCTFSDADVALGVNFATNNRANVINMSLGGPGGNSAGLQAALENAAAAGVIMTASTGNDGLTQPDFPAASATDPGMRGLLIAVGSVDSTSNLSFFSNQCGAAQNFCMVAPGSSIPTTNAASKGGGYSLVSGTSFSAPHVAGAATLLIQLFPNLSPNDIVNILFTSATDLGVAGIDPVFGHGLLNVDAAVLPAGVIAVPLGTRTNGQSLVLDDSQLVLGAAFGDALLGTGAFDQVIGLDAFRRAYPVDLKSRVAVNERDFGLDRLLSEDRSRSVSNDLPFGLSFGLTLNERESPLGLFPEERRPGFDFGSLRLSQALSENTALKLGYQVSPGWQFDLGPRDGSARGLFWSAPETLSPHYGLMGRGNGGSLDLALDSDTALSFGWFQEDQGGNLSTSGSSLGQARLDHQLGFGARLGLGAAYIAEADAFLGSETDGAFGTDATADSLFVTLSGSLPLFADVELVGSFTHGTTRLGYGTTGVLSDWSRVQSTAFGAGLVTRDVIAGRDRLGLLVGQPLRVYNASATVDLPVGVTADNEVVRNRDRVGVTPSGREIDLQLAYDIGVLPGVDVSSWMMMMLEPGHDARADTAYAAGIKLELGF